MSVSIIPQLVRKDFLIMRKTIGIFCLLSLTGIVVVSILFGRVPNVAFINLGITLLVAPSFTCAIVVLMRTIVMEKEKSTQLFVMSLPVSIKEFTLAKLLINLPLFFVLWLLTTAVAFYFSFGLGIFPLGTLPFISIVFLGILVGYICTLCVGLIFQSLSLTILTMCCFELGTPAYLWIIAFLEPINSHVYDAQMLWNSTAVGIVATQIFVVLAAPVITWYIQGKKRDLI